MRQVDFGKETATEYFIFLPRARFDFKSSDMCSFQSVAVKSFPPVSRTKQSRQCTPQRIAIAAAQNTPVKQPNVREQRHAYTIPATIDITRAYQPSSHVMHTSQFRTAVHGSKNSSTTHALSNPM
ncbi:unnamed protein product [Ectocarpus sp. 12 AP-2014]